MFTDPKSNIDQFGILPGQIVADLGSGSGFYAVECARAVGDKGHVYAVDIQQESLSRSRVLANRESLYNIDVIWGDLERLGGSHIPNGAVDAAVISNVLFQIQDKKGFMSELRRILKPHSRVLVIDWSDEFGAGGPPAQLLLPEASARTLFDGEGFIFEKEIHAGSSHYGFIYRTP